MSSDRNTPWARAFVDALAGCGLREAVVAPGSRSTPLVLALHEHPAVRTWTHLDERSAAFFALGMGKGSGRPAAVVTTSGTAVANLFPAVVEAGWSETPLLVLTGDRPRRLRGTDANQTIDQVGIFGGYVRAFLDLPEPVPEDAALRELGSMAARAVEAALGVPAGAVHVNAPFDKPLEPDRAGGGPGGPRVGPGRAAERETDRPRPEPEAGQVEELARLLAGASRGLVVAGPVSEPRRVGPALRAFAAATGYPLLADPLSGGRYGPSDRARVLGAYDLLLRQEAIWPRLAPEVVVRVGRKPTSAALGTFLGWVARGRMDGSMGVGGPPTRSVTPPPRRENVGPGLRTVVLDAGGLWKDQLGLTTDRVGADPVRSLEALAGALGEPPCDPDWARRWAWADETARGVAREHLDTRLFEGTVLAEAVAAAGPGASFFVGSSMPVRDLDAFGWPRDDPLTVTGNRGASGIDGSISTALGLAVDPGAEKGSAEPVVAVMGDVAFLHDLNGLLVADQVDRPVVLVVIQNDGGGIFHMLPIREHEPAFTRHFATPHGRDLRHAAALHGIPHRRIAGAGGGSPPSCGEVRRALREELGTARNAGGVRLLEIASGREENRLRHLEVVDAVRRALRED